MLKQIRKKLLLEINLTKIIKNCSIIALEMLMLMKEMIVVMISTMITPNINNPPQINRIHTIHIRTMHLSMMNLNSPSKSKRQKKN